MNFIVINKKKNKIIFFNIIYWLEFLRLNF